MQFDRRKCLNKFAGKINCGRLSNRFAHTLGQTQIIINYANGLGVFPVLSLAICVCVLTFLFGPQSDPSSQWEREDFVLKQLDRANTQHTTQLGTVLLQLQLQQQPHHHQQLYIFSLSHSYSIIVIIIIGLEAQAKAAPITANGVPGIAKRNKCSPTSTRTSTSTSTSTSHIHVRVHPEMRGQSQAQKLCCQVALDSAFVCRSGVLLSVCYPAFGGGYPDSRSV